MRGNEDEDEQEQRQQRLARTTTRADDRQARSPVPSPPQPCRPESVCEGQARRARQGAARDTHRHRVRVAAR